MKPILILSLLLLACSATWVQKLTSEELADEMDHNDKIYLVYHSNSGKHMELIEQAGQILQGFFKVAIVEHQNNQLVLYGDDRVPLLYEGEFNVQSLVEYVLKKFEDMVSKRSFSAKELQKWLEFEEKEKERAKKEWDEEQERRKKSDTLLLTKDNWQTFINSRESYLINFFVANCSNCIDLNREWEGISTAMKGRVKVAKINMSEPDNQILESQVQIVKFPVIRYYGTGVKKLNEYFSFAGVFKKFSIMEWLQTQMSHQSDTIEVPKLTAENYETLCKKTKNTCIIVFSEGDNRVSELAAKHAKKPITFLMVGPNEQTVFAKQTGVTAYPDTVLVYCKLKKIWRMAGFDLKSIEEAIDQIALGNRNNFGKMDFVEEIV